MESMLRKSPFRLIQDMYRTRDEKQWCAVRPGRVTVLCEGGTTPRLGLTSIPFLMDMLTDDVRKDVPGSIMFADDIVMCGDDETHIAEYLDTWTEG